jgi:deoxyribose-phosphate aldolase
MADDRVAVARRALSMLDLTELGDSATDADAVARCERAVTPHGPVAAVCVWPRHVRVARATLAGTDIPIATVVNFPSGDESVSHVVEATELALADGAAEIDLVLPYRAMLEGAVEHVVLMLESVRSAASTGGALLKVILETGELGGPEAIDAAARVAIAHGADFIKTSTGKTPASATPEATEVMLRAIADTSWPVGLKASGGIRTLDDAAVYLHQADRIMGPEWATTCTFRFGASGLLDALLAEIDRSSGVMGSGDY